MYINMEEGIERPQGCAEVDYALYTPMVVVVHMTKDMSYYPTWLLETMGNVLLTTKLQLICLVSFFLYLQLHLQLHLHFLIV